MPQPASAPGRAALHARAIAAIDDAAAELRRVSARIHERPELLFEERHAHDVLTAAAAAAGLSVRRGA
jgi:metal-dependent amidase/aminoacylase/carboxypeptidase family protein